MANPINPAGEYMVKPRYNALKKEFQNVVDQLDALRPLLPEIHETQGDYLFRLELNALHGEMNDTLTQLVNLRRRVHNIIKEHVEYNEERAAKDEDEIME